MRGHLPRSSASAIVAFNRHRSYMKTSGPCYLITAHCYFEFSMSFFLLLFVFKFGQSLLPDDPE